MSFSSFLADAPALRDRGEWFAFFYLTDPFGNEEILRFSRRGTPTDDDITVGGITIFAHTPFDKRIITAPVITQSMWQPGALLSRSLPSFGEIVLINTDGELDQYRPSEGYRWAGNRCLVFYADAYDIPNTIGLVFDGKMGHPRWGMNPSHLTIPLLGKEADFNVPTSTHVYRGTGYMLELFGDRTASYGTPSAVNITGSMTFEGWYWLDALPTAAPVTWGWFGGTAHPWRLGFLATGVFRIFAHIGGVQEIITSSLSMAAKKPYHLAVIISGRDVTFCLWDDDAQTETLNIQLNAFSSATRSSNSGGAYSHRSGNDTTYKIWFDECRVWNVARSLSDIRRDRFREIPNGAIPASLVHYTRFNDGSGTTVTDSSATGANGTISGAGTSAWLWSMEGGPELSGKSKSDVWGKRFGVRPVLVDPIHKAYQIAGGGAVQSITTYEGGNPHTMDATAASMRAFITATPTAAHSLPYLARGYFMLGSSPTLPVAATVEGYNGGSLGYVSTPGPISRDIITRRGPKIVDPTGLDTSSFTAYGTAAAATTGIALYEPNNQTEYIGPVLDMVNAAGLGWWGYVGSSVLFHIQQFTGPSGTADYDLSSAIIDVEDVSPPPPVIYEVVVRYHHNDVVLQEGEADTLAGTVVGTLNWTQWTLPYLEKPSPDEDLREEHEGNGGLSLVIDTGLYNDADAQALADSTLAMMKGVKEVFIVTLIAAGLEIEIGMTVTLTFEYQDGTQRFGLDGTKKYLVIATELALQQGQIKITVWG